MKPRALSRAANPGDGRRVWRVSGGGLGGRSWAGVVELWWVRLVEVEVEVEVVVVACVGFNYEDDPCRRRSGSTTDPMVMVTRGLTRGSNQGKGVVAFLDGKNISKVKGKEGK